MGTRLASDASFDIQSLTKRLRQPYKPDLEQYDSGAILRVKLQNFMSYSLTEFHFGPTMNLIIGPNGTGKSTFVCAVCIGLGGKLDYLGKASMNVDQFIKSGEKEGSIELELKGANSFETVVVERKLYRKAKSVWYVNNRPSNESQVKALLKEYNIQLDNLCQFLPQDRVARFASLKPEELLKEIERLYENGELLEQHNKLMELHALRQEKTKALADIEFQMSALNEKRKSLEERAQQYHEYQRLEKELAKHETLRPYVELSTVKKHRDDLKQKVHDTSQKVEEFDQKILPMKETLTRFRKNLGDTDTKIKECTTTKETLNKEIEKHLKDIESYDSKIQGLADQRASLATSLETHREKWKQLTEDLQVVNRKLESLELASEEEIEKLKNHRTAVLDQILEEQESLDNLETERRALTRSNKQLEDRVQISENSLSSKDRLLLLDSTRYGNIIKAARVLREKKKELKLHYFEPPIISLTVTDKKYGPALERSIRFQNQCAFTVPNNNEYHKLSHFLYNEHPEIGRNIGIRTLSDNFSFQSRIPVEEIKKYQFDGYLVDFIEGPREVVQMVCENDRINNIPVAYKDLSLAAKDTLSNKIRNENFPLTEFIAGEAYYSFNKSNYGSKQVTTNIRGFAANRASIFSGGLPDDKRVEIQKQIDENKAKVAENGDKLSKLVQAMKSKQESLSQLTKERDQATAKISRQTKAEKDKEKYITHIETIKDRIRVEKREISKIKHRENEGFASKLLSKIGSLEQKKIETFELIEPKISKICDLDEQLLDAQILAIQENNKYSTIQSLNESILTTRDELVQELKEAKADYSTAKENYSKALREYKAQLDSLSDEDRTELENLVAELQENETLTEEGLNAEISRIKSQMRLRRNGAGADSLKRLEEVEKQIDQFEARMPEYEIDIGVLSKEIEDLAAVWKPKLEFVIRIIARDFGENLKAVASAGDVQLDCESESFAEWKLKIMVSFRDSQALMQLNAAQQSGGEKSATTAVFLNSLQGLTNTPFRVVDEINQGMDSKNERLIHELIVRKACSARGSQYFLITPKLLTNLYYGDGMRVHCILAGRWCPEYEDSMEFLEMGVTDKYF
ncbi:hypothetical protein OGAPHI_004848 [Ogataea philodendri]|uniref:Structural maintenance of chromosomes protein 5 n=1 Tax=Ogataea philodendri TaxID=1378263 RepID=A0A9P8P316_9ASCO|nr:uncharacterized protein OGAPHI_004848 [Ogataea philodendri]KAH3664134.1 hypothetical protein OGAPHI_004848 [Ogataea philodendri]